MERKRKMIKIARECGMFSFFFFFFPPSSKDQVRARVRVILLDHDDPRVSRIYRSVNAVSCFGGKD